MCHKVSKANFEQNGARVFKLKQTNKQKKTKQLIGLFLRVLLLLVGHTIATLTVDWILYVESRLKCVIKLGSPTL